jgi:hypothetical protein
MPTSTYDLVASSTLGSAVATVTFSSIPSTYRDLVLIVGATSSVNAQMRVRPNGLTTNQRSISAEGNGSASASVGFSDLGQLSQFNYFGTAPTIQIVQFFDYAQTDKHKSVLIRMNRADTGTAMMAGRWASTTAITSIDIFNDSGNFSIGSTFHLYGIAA